MVEQERTQDTGEGAAASGHEPSAAQPKDNVFVSDNAPATSTAKRVLIGSVIAGLLLVGGMAVAYYNRSDNTSYRSSNVDPNLPSDYSTMTHEQIGQRLNADTGLDIEELQKTEPSSRAFKNFDQAYKAAQALHGLQDYKRSLQVYEIAGQKADKTTSHEFYLQYADVAEQQKKNELYNQLIEKAKQAIESDANLDAKLKKEKIEQLDQLRRLKELGY